MLIEESARNLSAEDLDAFQAAFGGKVPGEFLAFYARHNGGYPDRDGVLGDGREFQFQRFIPIKFDRLPIETLRRDMKPDFELNDFLPFGHDAVGNVFCLSTAAAGHDKVYLITAETKNIIPVAESFADFIAALASSGEA